MKILGPDPAGIKPDAGRGVPKLENFCEKTPVVQVNQPYRPRSDRVCVDLTGVLDRSFQIARIFVSVRNPDYCTGMPLAACAHLSVHPGIGATRGFEIG